MQYYFNIFFKKSYKPLTYNLDSLMPSNFFLCDFSLWFTSGPSLRRDWTVGPCDHVSCCFPLNYNTECCLRQWPLSDRGPLFSHSDQMVQISNWKQSLESTCERVYMQSQCCTHGHKVASCKCNSGRSVGVCVHVNCSHLQGSVSLFTDSGNKLRDNKILF